MPRRHLRVVCSSSDEEDDAASHQPPPSPPQPPLSNQIPPIQVDDDEELHSDQITHSEVGITLQTMNLSSSNSNSVNPNISRLNPNIIVPIPFNISNDEMDGVVHEPSPINPVTFGNNPVYNGINAILRRMGAGAEEGMIGSLHWSPVGLNSRVYRA